MKTTKRIAPFLIGLVLSVGYQPGVPAAAEEVDYTAMARLLASRIRGGSTYNLKDAELTQMVNLLQQGKRLEAAEVATKHRHFLEVTVRRFASPMVNLSMSERITMNDALATILGAVHEDLDFHEILYRPMRYEITHSCCSGGTPQSYANYDRDNSSYEVYPGGPRVVEAPALIQFLKRNDTVSGNLVPEDRAGIMASDFWASEFYSAGTNRRPVKGLVQLSCMDLEEIRSQTGYKGLIARDIPRTPDPNQPTLFDTYCGTCHYMIDALRDAFGLVNFDDNEGRIISNGSGNIQGKYISSNDDIVDDVNRGNLNVLPFPAGHKTTNTSWEITLPEGLKSSMGWSGATSGVGMISLGKAWSKMKRFNSCMVERAARVVCPGTRLSTALVDNIAAEFEANGNMRQVFMKIATRPECLGF